MFVYIIGYFYLYQEAKLKGIIALEDLINLILVLLNKYAPIIKLK